MVNAMGLGGGDEGTTGAHRTNILAPFLNEGFGYKKDSAWYLRTARLLSIWNDLPKNLAYRQMIFSATESTVLTHLIKDRNIPEHRAKRYVNSFNRVFRRLYYGPGTAWLVQPGKRGVVEILYSDVGYLELRPMTEPFIDPDDDNGAMRVRTQSFKVNLLRCPKWKTEICPASRLMVEFPPSAYVLKKCMHCPLRKKAQVIDSSAGNLAAKGITVNFQNRLMLMAQRQLDEAWGKWEKHLTTQLSIPGPVKAPEWSEYAGKFIEDDDDFDPNKDWEKKIPENPQTEWIFSYGGDYPAWLRAKGFPIETKATFPNEDKAKAKPTYPSEEEVELEPEPEPETEPPEPPPSS